MSIAFATYSKDSTPDGIDHSMSGDDLLAEELRMRNFPVTSLPWNQPEVDWTQFCAVVVRRTWDNHLKRNEYLSWIDELEKKQMKLLNPSHVLRWNTDKTYLLELKDQGVPLIDTVFLEPSDTAPSLKTIMVKSGWTKAVFKPVVGMNGHNVIMVVDLNDATTKQTFFERLLKESRGVMVQRYMDSVDTFGEISLVFLGGKYSHALLMKSRADNSRGNCSHNDIIRVEKPDAAALATGYDVMKALPWKQPPVYARVDIVEDSARGGYALMEVDLVDPLLYFKGQSVKRMTDLIEEAIRGG